MNIYRIHLPLIFFFIVGCGQSDNSHSDDKSSKNTEIKQEIVIVDNKIPMDTCNLIMGWEPWEPYHYEDQEKIVKGLDIELMELIEKETGCKISYQRGDWKVLLVELKVGKVDFLTGASINTKRKEYARFSDGYRTESFRLFVRYGETAQFSGFNMKSLIDNGFRLGITMDYIYNDEVDSLQDDPTNADNIVAVSSGLINFAKLVEGDIDGFLEDPVVGSSSIRRQGLENQIELHPYEINTGDVHLMFSRASVDEGIILRFNKALAQIKLDGRHDRLMKKYTH